MKKFLLSIFAVMLAVFSVQAETKTYTYDFSKNTNWVTTKGGSTAVATGSTNKLNAFYDKATGDVFNAGGKGYFPSTTAGYFLWGASGAYIELPTYAGEKITNVTAKSSSGHSTSVTVGIYSGSTSVVSAKTWSTKSSLYSYDIPAEYQSEVLRLQVTNSKNSQVVSITITTETTGGGGGETPVVETVATPTFNPADGATFEESLPVTISSATEGATIHYTLNGGTERTGVSPVTVTVTETTEIVAFATKTSCTDSDKATATYTKNELVTPPAEGEVVDVLNRELTGIEKNAGYSTWTGKTATSSAVYAGMSAGNNDAIQLKSKDSTSGIVTTASGGKVKKIVVVWQSSTSDDRTLNVYGKNTAYSTAADLYSTSTQGTLLGTIVCGTSTELVIEGDYEYIGVCSASGAMYLTSISITWDESAGVTPVVPNAPVLPESTTFKGSMLVEITGIAADATVYYTTDESDPATSDTRVEYTEPFEITATTTVKAVAVNEVGASEMKTATYTLFVVEETTGYYIKVVSAPADWSGKYLIVYEDGTDAYVFNGNDEVNGYVSAVTDGDVIKANSEIDAVAVTIAAMEGGYSISTVSGYMYKTAYSNGVDFGETAKAANTFEIAEDGVVITSGNNDDKTTFRYNKAVDQMRFRYYKSGQQPVQLYKYVEELPLYQTLTVSDAGYATLFLGFNARIPSAVEAYTVTAVNSGWVSLTKVTGVLPSNQGVIIKAPARDYKFFNEATATADVTGNLLSGSTYNKNIEEEAYVLGKFDGVVGLYKAEMNQMDGTAWLNNANKAYLPASALTPAQQTAAFYGFDWDGTTGVDQITDNREQSTAIYDLTGRRVEAITAPGIYVVNGKKVLVK